MRPMTTGGFSIIAAFGVAAATAFAEDDAQTPVMVEWSADAVSPGICVGKTTWFVSVAPSSVKADSKPTLIAGDQRVAAKVLHFDSDLHLCLLEVAEPLADLTLFSLAPNPVGRAGEKLSSLSTYGDCRSTIAGKDWSYRGEPLDMPLLRIRVEDSEHFCHPGTPLVNKDGQIEGILTDRILATKTEAHAIPASQIRKLLRDMERYDRTGKVWLGLLLHEESTTPEVIEVVENSPAEKSGFASGDVILSLNQTEIENLSELVEAIHDLPAGEKATFEILRGLSRKEIQVVPQFAVSLTDVP